MGDLANLKLKRGHIKGKLTRGERFIEGFSEDADIELIRERKANLQTVLREFEEIQIQIAALSPEDETIETESDNFEQQYFRVIATINNILKRRQPAPVLPAVLPRGDGNSNNNRFQQNNNSMLPKIKLPSFSGSYSEFLSFYDNFDSLVNKDPNLNDCQKLNFLRTCLTGEALRAIEALSVSSANYQIALNILEKRFKNERLIIQDHINAILSAPNIFKNSDISLRQLLDTITINLEALKVLKEPVDSWDSIVVTIINSKLDYNTKRDWEATLNNSNMPKLSDLKEFLEKRSQFLASVNAMNKTSNNKSQQWDQGQSVNKTTSNKQRTVNTYHVSKGNNVICYLCKGEHPIYQCSKFLGLSVSDRRNEVKNLKLCFNCLLNNHPVTNCKSKYSCKECKQRHNSLIHVHGVDYTDQHTNQINIDAVSNHSFLSYQSVLLSTALVLIKNNSNQFIECRALLDAGSQSNFLSEQMANQLNIKLQKTELTVGGINQTVSTITKAAKVIIKSRFNQSIDIDLKCFVIPKVTENLPSDVIDKSSIHIPPNVKLADPYFYECRPVDLLIGAALFWDLLGTNKIPRSGGQPHFQESKLGWLIGGPININNPSKISCHFSTFKGNSLENKIESFWALEEMGNKPNLSVAELECDMHFRNNVKRDHEGRFIVRLPFKNNTVDIGRSLEQATKRFYSLERKLSSNLNLRKSYNEFMDSYLNLDYIGLVPDTEIEKRESCYLPHHPVIKASSTTTKLRVVFDASCKTSNGLSINDNLLPGPNLQQDIFLVLARFRTYQYVLNADIEKMYQQIKIDEEDVDYQRIIWRKYSDSPIQIYRLKRLPFGMKPAPYLAMRCIKELAKENETKFPLASAVIKTDLYMDDFLSGQNTIPEALLLRDQVIEILEQGKFKLRKWASNEPRLLPAVSESLDSVLINLDKNGDIKTLGLTWNYRDDILKYVTTELPIANRKFTKRSILSTITKIYDPLGLITPFVVKAKLIMQQLWSININWDQPVPKFISDDWNQFLSQLCYLNHLNISRKVIPQIPVTLIEIHGFADASMQAYGAAIYIRTRNNQGQYSTHLLCARSRVAPLKTITLPRLELCASLLLARLIHKTVPALGLQVNKQYLWTDSSIVLSWLASPPNTWQAFVANRVSEIQELTLVEDWHHISTRNNSADVITRGMYPETLIKTNLWWHGPQFLSTDISEWPISTPTAVPADIQEKRKTVLANIVKSELPIFTKLSSFLKLQRVIGYCLRFIDNCRDRTQEAKGLLTCTELTKAHNVIIDYIQKREFHDEIHALSQGKDISKNSRLISLDPFIDPNDKLLRVGGRIKNSSLAHDQKHQIILPSKHYVTRLLIKQQHERHLHGGQQLTLAAIRQKYWPVAASSEIRKIIYDCVKCFRTHPRRFIQKMGDLPKVRLERARPFINVGIDYAGPIFIKQGNARSRIQVKAYIALFICLVTKAIHLELVGDLTSESFLNALKRFMSRRGKILNIYSDNGTNFVGGKNELEEMNDFLKSAEFQTNIVNNLTSENITWHMIPPKGPHMGGIWESGIKLVKSHLRKILGTALVTYEEMHTLLTRIEACLNSRPIIAISNDPHDYEVLTPGHFLIGESLTAPIETDLRDVPDNRLSRWQRIEQLRQHFWSRWTHEYINTLQQRRKWHTTPDTAIAVGTMVIVADDNSPPLLWKLGRIIATHPGKDNQVRVVTVRTPQGVYKRPAVKVCPLPCNDK